MKVDGVDGVRKSSVGGLIGRVSGIKPSIQSLSR